MEQRHGVSIAGISATTQYAQQEDATGTPPLTPRLSGTAATPRPTLQRKDSSTLSNPPNKRLKSTPAKTPRPSLEDGDSQFLSRSSQHQQLDEPVTPIPSGRKLGADDETDWYEDIKEARTPMGSIDRHQSITSSPSDLSAASARARDRSLSPMTPYVPEVPPAPPSTPASDLRSVLNSGPLDGLSTPLPYAAVKNAALLEQQQMLEEGAVTPAPTKNVPRHGSSTSGGDTAGSNTSTLLGEKGSGKLIDDFSEWAVGDRYKLLRMLGRGSYGEVAQALDLSQGRSDAYVAIKRIQSPFDQEVDAVRLFREIHILRRLKGHECVIDLLDVVQPPTDDLDDFYDLYLVFEYVDTDLYKLIMSPQFLTTEHIQTFLYQMLVGLKFLHSASVIHRDLKPANILLNEDCSLKICDFGLARIVDEATMRSSSKEGGSDPAGRDTRPKTFKSIKRAPLQRQLTKHVVTRWYRAPELILIQPYTSAVDIWSLGCILAELLSMQDGNVPGYQDRAPLFPGGTCYPLSGDSGVADERLDQLSVIFKVIGTPPPEDIAAIGKANEYIKTLGNMKPKRLQDLFPVADPSALDLLEKMLKFNPEHRCTADEALQHDFLKGVRRNEMERTAEKPLISPEFLNSLEIDLQTLKQKTYDEVLWYRNQSPNQQNSATSQGH